MASLPSAPLTPPPIPNSLLAPQGSSFPKIKGTTILMQKGNIPVRVVTATGAQFAPHDVVNVQAHINSLAPAASDRPQHVKMKGTHIVMKVGGIAVRVATASGKEFAPDDYVGVQDELNKIAKGLVTLAPAPNITECAQKSKKKLDRKVYTPEELEAHRQKNLQRFQAKVAAEERVVVEGGTFNGEVVCRGSYSAVWIRPLQPNDIQGDVQVKLEDMNSELREKAKEHKRKFANGATENLIYAALHDVSEDGLVLKSGLQVKFKLYIDTKGVGACEICSI